MSRDKNLVFNKNAIRFNPKAIGSMLGSGMYGSVFEYRKTRVIKFLHTDSDGFYYSSRVGTVLTYIKNHPHKWYAPIYKCGRFKYCGKPFKYYISKKLFELTHSDFNYSAWEYRLDIIDKERNLLYDDLHHGNVMKDSNGNQFIIDLDTFIKCE